MTGACERASDSATTGLMSALFMVRCNRVRKILETMADFFCAENTLNKLFAAQRNHPHAEPIPSETLVQAPQPLTSKPQKSTLHSFWKQLPAPQAQPLVFSLPMPAQQVAHGPRCDDCDTPLQSEDAMDMDINMDNDAPVGESPFACSECGKNVCSTCAVVATKRHCLQCATRGRQSRRWW